jgi:pimeloyl-ACP methyl ester carboxylesterase
LVEKEIDDIEALIDVAGGKAYLYGHSSGAALALEAALKFPEKVVKVAVYDPSYVHSETEKEKYKILSNRILMLLSEKKNKQAMKTFLSGIGMPKFFVWLLPIFPGWKTMHKLAPTLAYDIEITKDLPPLERFRNIKSPALVMAGSKNSERIRNVASQIATAIPGSNFEEVIGQDHMVSAKVLLPKFIKFFGTDML